MLSKMDDPEFPSESTFCTPHSSRHAAKSSHIDTKPFRSTAVSLSTVTVVPKLSSSGISKTSTMLNSIRRWCHCHERL